MKNDRVILDTELNNKLKFDKLTSQGLTPYYFNDTWGKDFGLVKITAPISGRGWDNKPKQVFLLTDDEYATTMRMVDNIREIIELFKGLYENLGYDEPTVSKLTENMACRLESEWYRKHCGWNNEKIHNKIGVE